MTLNILYANEADAAEVWVPHIETALAKAGISAQITQSQQTPECIDYVVYAPSSGLLDFTPYTQLKAVLSLWAGVDQIVGNETIKCPITRMSDAGLREGMVEYVTGHVLRHHLGMDADITCPAQKWQRRPAPPLARNSAVGILGFGELGQACGAALGGLGFRVLGWSRSAKNHPTAQTFHGAKGLTEILGASDYLVLLLPDTPQTQNLINDQSLSAMKPGAFIINAGRGPSIDDEALVAALDQGKLAGATLDVFREEPLPEAHPFWAHPKVTVTPHIAAETRPDTAATLIAENIRRSLADEPLLYQVDRTAGY